MKLALLSFNVLLKIMLTETLEIFLISLLFLLFLTQGSSKRQILTLAARTLAGAFRDQLKASADSLMENALVM